MADLLEFKRFIDGFDVKPPTREEGRGEERLDERKIWASRGIKPLYYGASWDNWHVETDAMRDALGKVKRAWKSNLLMTGNFGTGKTHLAMCLVKDGATYRRFSDISRKIRAKFDGEEGLLDDLAERRLLVIDEIGRNKSSDFERNILFEIIDRRYEAKLPTTLITNMSAEEFATEYGAAMLDRFRPLTAVFSWPSYRGKA